MAVGVTAMAEVTAMTVNKLTMDLSRVFMSEW
jgi:hypothetical protein